MRCGMIKVDDASFGAARLRWRMSCGEVMGWRNSFFCREIEVRVVVEKILEVRWQRRRVCGSSWSRICSGMGEVSCDESRDDGGSGMKYRVLRAPARFYARQQSDIRYSRPC